MILAALPNGRTVELERPDAERLVEALWAVSAEQGAVVAIGKLEHRLTRAASDRTVDVSELEAHVIGIALATAPTLTPTLEQLREATGA
jgi:hypothetical protein